MNSIDISIHVRILRTNTIPAFAIHNRKGPNFFYLCLFLYFCGALFIFAYYEYNIYINDITIKFFKLLNPARHGVSSTYTAKEIYLNINLDNFG